MMSILSKAPCPDGVTENYGASRRLRGEFLNDHTPEMQRRRWIVGLSMVGVSMAQLIALQQMGVIRLPEPPAPGVDDGVNDAPYAYKRMATPNAVLQIVSYGVTAALAAAGGSSRSAKHPGLPMLLFAKAAYDTFIAGKLAQEGIKERHAVSIYPTISAVTTVATLALAAMDAFGAGRNLAGRAERYAPQIKRRGSDLMDRLPFVGSGSGGFGSEARH